MFYLYIAIILSPNTDKASNVFSIISILVNTLNSVLYINHAAHTKYKNPAIKYGLGY